MNKYTCSNGQVFFCSQERAVDHILCMIISLTKEVYLMSEREVRQNPLLYIEQQGSVQPKADMQTYYRTSLQDKVAIEENEESLVHELTDDSDGIENNQQALQQNYFHHVLQRRIPKPQKDIKSDAQEVEEAQEEALEEEEVQIDFEKLSVREKIDYLIDDETMKEKEQTIITTDEDYLGTIVSFEDHHVYLKQDDQEDPVELFVENIKDIEI